MNRKEELLMEKYGGIRGGQALLARELNTIQSTVARWFNGKGKPSPDYVKGLAKVFKKTEDEIKEVFEITGGITQNANNNRVGGNLTQTIEGGDIELLKKDIEVIKLQLALILEKLKGSGNGK
jgi:transcriptional regulator with XRE-family HTH domain